MKFGRFVLILFIYLTFINVRVMAKEKNAYDFNFTNIEGEEFKLSKFKGRVLLIVNTASNCGFTSQYADLEKLYSEYKDEGLVVIAVPSNNFGEQEPGNNQEIREFCNAKFKITFPIVNKEEVTGKNANPFYKWASDKVGFFGSPKWNFHKYLIGRDGELKEWFASTTSPSSASVKKAIEKELAQNSNS